MIVCIMEYDLAFRGAKVIIFGLIAASLTACTSDDIKNDAETYFKPSDITKVNTQLFQHPFFDSLSKICLPYIDAVSRDSSSSIDKFIQEAGFRNDRIYPSHHPIRATFSTGDINRGAEVYMNWTGDASRLFSCSSTSVEKGRNTDSPSLPEFTEWLNTQEDGWSLTSTKIENGLDKSSLNEANMKIVGGKYCKNENTEFEQSLEYNFTPNHRATEINPLFFNVSTTGKNKCSSKKSIK